jgi:ABC-type sulfate/molybdate transport systems ATPase subunit
MTTIELQNVKNYACRGINLKVLSGELLVLLGPNGAGKTTLLNIIAGLTKYKGLVLFDDRPVNKLSARERRVGYLFQDRVLFPHLDVASNVAYGLKAQKWNKEKIKLRVKELLRLSRIEHLATAYPWQLSGGEKQRVALSRTLAPYPGILLLDEPLGSLDWHTSRHFKFELKSVQQQLGITTLYVTHNLIEAQEIADRTAVILEGHIKKIGTPKDLHSYLHKYYKTGN